MMRITIVNNPWVGIRRKRLSHDWRKGNEAEVRNQLETFFSIMTVFLIVLANNKV